MTEPTTSNPPADAQKDSAPSLAPATEVVTLDTPIKRGASIIATVTVRKPRAGELRGVALIELAQLDVIALQKVLPRITQPTLTAQEVAEMDPADLLELGTKVALFLARREMVFDIQTA